MSSSCSTRATANAAALRAATDCQPSPSVVSLAPPAWSLMARTVAIGTLSFNWPARAKPALSISTAIASL
jgi:hypothetical protein